MEGREALSRGRGTGMADQMMRASVAAEYLGVSYFTLRKWTVRGDVPCQTTLGGQRVYNKKDLDAIANGGKPAERDCPPRIAFYIRSSNGNQKLMDTQLEHLTQKYGEPERVYKDKASGLNENRKGLTKLIKDANENKFDIVAVTSQDRLTRFGYTYIEQILKDRNVTIESLNETPQQNTHDELMHDFMALIASFAGRFYRLRGYEQQKRLLHEAEEELDHKSHKNKNHNDDKATDDGAKPEGEPNEAAES